MKTAQNKEQVTIRSGKEQVKTTPATSDKAQVNTTLNKNYNAPDHRALRLMVDIGAMLLALFAIGKMILTSSLYSKFTPHGLYWQRSVYLTMLHAPADLLAFGACMVILITTAHVYRCGLLSRSKAAYPSLWKLGSLFVLFCALARLGNFMEVWYGGVLYWITGVNKVLLAVISCWFAYALYNARNDLVLIGRMLSEVGQLQGRREMENVEADRISGNGISVGVDAVTTTTTTTTTTEK